MFILILILIYSEIKSITAKYSPSKCIINEEIGAGHCVSSPKASKTAVKLEVTEDPLLLSSYNNHSGEILQRGNSSSSFFFFYKKVHLF